MAGLSKQLSPRFQAKALKERKTLHELASIKHVPTKLIALFKVFLKWFWE